ncbi:AAA family ATPase [Shewanella algae]|uniref:AAA family ATPase n=1 Tax=Shewanella algae TaxID=38313 RepID=UPI001AACB9A9|nr:DUF3696 domain-containing protein [Shewanella algae]MBO2651202.1 DUF3696 domain-containing protein [Shewanella algae]
MTITKIRLENFKCFSEAEFEIGKLTFLVGLNSVGKSSVIQSALLPLQSSNINNIEINGNLINLGSYQDILNIKAQDDSVRISIEADDELSVWGYPEGYITNSQQTGILPLLSGTTKNLSSVKNNFQYISAERWGPRDNVPVLHRHRDGWLGKNGEHVIDYLFSLTNTTNASDYNNLQTNDPRIHRNARSTTILASIEAWLREISPGVSFDVSVYKEANIGWSLFGYEGDSKKYRASNVGFGISYSLGIISAILGAKPGDVLILENPEAHIHPRGQSQLGNLLALATEAGIQLLVETHSEHVVNGARVAIKKHNVDHSNILIYFFSKDASNSCPEITKITPDERASLSAWPSGFLDQTVVDMELIIRG